MEVTLIATLQFPRKIAQGILLLGSIARRWYVIIYIPRIMHLPGGPTVVLVTHPLRYWWQAVNPKGGHIFGKLATHTLGKWGSQGEIEESRVEFGALGEGDLSLDSTRVDESSGVEKSNIITKNSAKKS